MGVGMPGSLYLQQFGDYVRKAWGHVPYHVGSSLTMKDGWRDVDVRLILSDVEYEALGFGDPRFYQNSQKWVAHCLAWSAFGRALTGFPIDFQIQQQTYANSQYPKGQRSGLFSVADIHDQPPA